MYVPEKMSRPVCSLTHQQERTFTVTQPTQRYTHMAVSKSITFAKTKAKAHTFQPGKRPATGTFSALTWRQRNGRLTCEANQSAQTPFLGFSRESCFARAP